MIFLFSRALTNVIKNLKQIEGPDINYGLTNFCEDLVKFITIFFSFGGFFPIH